MMTMATFPLTMRAFEACWVTFCVSCDVFCSSEGTQVLTLYYFRFIRHA